MRGCSKLYNFGLQSQNQQNRPFPACRRRNCLQGVRPSLRRDKLRRRQRHRHRDVRLRIRPLQHRPRHFEWNRRSLPRVVRLGRSSVIKPVINHWPTKNDMLYRVTHLLANLGWADLDLVCSTILPSCPASSANFPSAQAEPDRVEQPKSKSTQPRFARRCVTLYNT